MAERTYGGYTLEQLREMLAKATKGEWSVTDDGFLDCPRGAIAQFWDKCEEDFIDWEDNSALIAAARNAFADLLAAAEEAQRLREALEALVWDVDNKAGDPHTLRHAREAIEQLKERNE